MIEDRPESITFPNLEISWDDAKLSIIQWIKVIAFSFVIPMGIVVFINEAAVLWKIISWFQLKIEFWNIRKFWIFTLVVGAIPLVYSVWFYFITLTKLMRLMQEHYFKKIDIEIGKLFARFLMESSSQKDLKLSIEKVVLYLNRQLSKLPGILEWVARKLFDKIPFLNMANWYDVSDLDSKNQAKIAEDVAKKLDELTHAAIDEITPGWMKFIIPVNLILLYFYWSL